MSSFSFKLDKKSQDEFENMLKQAAALPRRKVSTAAKNGAKIAMLRSKEILLSSDKQYKMKFEDGNTWTKKDIINNLGIKLEKGKRKQKRVARVVIKDWRVNLYANFPEFGYTKKDGTNYPATHFMRDGLTETNLEVQEEMVETLRKELDKLR